MSRRRPNVRQYSAEDQALTDISKEAENRLAAKRAARAEAREIRMKEIERQQKEVEEKEKQGNTSSDGPSRIRPPASTGGSSRRGSDDSTEGGGDGPSGKDRDMKKELRALEDKYKQAMMTSAQLDNEKQSLVYNLELLKDQLEEQAESYTELQREYKDKHRDLELTKRELEAAKLELKGLREQNDYKDRLISESGLVIVAAENGELALERSKEALSSNGPIGTGGVLLSSEALDLLNKGREGSLGTHSLASSPPPPPASHSTHPPPATTTALPLARPKKPKAESDNLDGSSVDGQFPEGSSVDVICSSPGQDEGGDGGADTLNAQSCPHSPDGKQSENAIAGLDLSENVQGSEGSDNSALVGMLSSSHDKDNIRCNDDTLEGSDSENASKSGASLQDGGLGPLPSVIVTGCSHSQRVGSAESEEEEGDEFFDAVSTPSPRDPGKKFEVEGVSTGETSTDTGGGQDKSDKVDDEASSKDIEGGAEEGGEVVDGLEEGGEVDGREEVEGLGDESRDVKQGEEDKADGDEIQNGKADKAKWEEAEAIEKVEDGVGAQSKNIKLETVKGEETEVVEKIEDVKKGEGVEEVIDGGDFSQIGTALADGVGEGGEFDATDNVHASTVSAEEKDEQEAELISQGTADTSLGGWVAEPSSSESAARAAEESGDEGSKGQAAIADESGEKESVKDESDGDERDGEPSSEGGLKEMAETSDVLCASVSTNLDGEKAEEQHKGAVIGEEAQDAKDKETEGKELTAVEKQSETETRQSDSTSKADEEEASVEKKPEDAESAELDAAEHASTTQDSEEMSDTLSPLRKPRNRDQSEGNTSEDSEALLEDYDFDDIDEALADGSPVAKKNKGTGERTVEDTEGDTVSFGSRDSGLQESIGHKDNTSFGSRDSGLQEGKESQGGKEDAVSLQSKDSGADGEDAGGVAGAEGGVLGVVGSRESLDLEAKLDKLASEDAVPISPPAKDKHGHKKSKFKRFKNIFHHK